MHDENLHPIIDAVGLKMAVKAPADQSLEPKPDTLSVGTVWRHEKVGRIAMVFKCLREESIYNVGASLYRLAAGRWDER
jgi:hypothetical protein